MGKTIPLLPGETGFHEGHNIFFKEGADVFALGARSTQEEVGGVDFQGVGDFQNQLEGRKVLL